MPTPRGGDPGRGSTQTELATSITATTDEPRRILRRARRVLGAELGHDRVNPELLAAAELVLEAGGR